MTVERGDAVELARELVRIDSRNPTLVAGGPGEQTIARALAEVLEAWGFRVAVHEAAPGRPNVVARIGAGGGASLMFNGHLDVVDTHGMDHPPFDGLERDGRLYGRGAADMKGGVAAMCAAAVRAADEGFAGEVVVAAVADEECESIGTSALIERGVRADAAIVTEPTRLTIMPAHRGFAWLEVTVHGHAAHGSRYDLGVDAIRDAALLLAELDAVEEQTLTARSHALLGRASLHASRIEGGSGMSTYPDRCTFWVERRTLPGEDAATALEEMHMVVERVRARRPALAADVQLLAAQAPSDVAIDTPIVRALASAITAGGAQPEIQGMSAWTDAALLNEAGIPAICYGPGDIALAHSATEWVACAEIEHATTVLARLARRWCDGGERAWRS
ncbi:MAG TPA: ArgE/DapE family deacylase [Gemmatimonadaceae bacterium]|nr:ArgE/DapE family deacylase [Gemmatimonadaceae bacterium]